MKYIVLVVISLFVLSCKNDPGTVTSQLRIISVSPNQITAGQKNIGIEIAGSGFLSASAVSCGADVSVQSFEVLDASRIRVTVSVDSAAVPGPRPITVVSPSGSGNLDAGLEILKNRPPKSSFTVEPPSGSQGTIFTFDGRSSTDPDGRIKKYLWEFGDGTTSTKAVAKHQFLQTGKQIITLKVTDDTGLEDSRQQSVKVLFDLDTAKKQIDAVCKEFLMLFADLETLSAEEIVVGFSRAGGCHGRQHEIDIIHRNQSLGGFVDVDILSSTQILDVNEQTATANLGARFYGRQGDGTVFDGIVTHEFQMINEKTGWKICNFIAY